MCKYCEAKEDSKVEFEQTDSMKRKVFHYVALGEGWGFHNKTYIVHDELKGINRILKITQFEYVATQEIEYCPKCGRKLSK